MIYTHTHVFAQWLEKDLLGYFETCEKEVVSSNRTAEEKRKMLLSDETLWGITMTGVQLYIILFMQCDNACTCLIVFPIQ